MVRAPTSRNRSSWLTSSLTMRQHPPRRGALVPGHVELLDVGVGLHPELMLDRLGQAPPQHGRDVVRERLHDPDDHVERRDHQPAGRSGPRCRRGGRERVRAPDDDVDRHPEQQLGGDVGGRVDRGRRDRGDHPRAEPAVVAPQCARGRTTPSETDPSTVTSHSRGLGPWADLMLLSRPAAGEAATPQSSDHSGGRSAAPTSGAGSRGVPPVDHRRAPVRPSGSAGRRVSADRPAWP